MSYSRLQTRWLSLLCVIVSLCFSISGAYADQPGYTHLTILYTNDVHGHLFPFDYDALGIMETNVGGAARRATLIRKIKSETSNPVIVMDAGDVFARGPLQDLQGEPDFAVMNAVPYDVMTLGNHEFDGDAYMDNPGPKGREILQKRISQAKLVIVSANVVDKETGRTIVEPYHIFDLSGIKVGVIGLTTPLTAKYRQTASLSFLEPIAITKDIVSQLDDRCDIIIALSHLGFLPDIELAYDVPEIDVIIGGDTHTWVFSPINIEGRTLVCQAGEWGKTLGRLDLTLTERKVSNYNGQLIDINPAIEPAKDIQAIIDHYTEPYTTKIGSLNKDIPLKDAAAWIAERLQSATKADIGFRPRDGVESGLAAGPITELDLRKMVPWDNKVVIVKATGTQIKNLMLQSDAGFYGAELRNGQLYIGGLKANSKKTYTLASADYYAYSSPALKGAEIEKMNYTIRECLAGYFK